MKGIIINFHIAYTKEVLVRVQGITDKKKAARLIGKRAVWVDPKKREHIGHIVGVHATSGTMKAKFKKALPSNCLAKPIEIRD